MSEFVTPWQAGCWPAIVGEGQVGQSLAIEYGAALMAKLTQRGLDVAQGRSRVPGVRRPGPEE